MEWSSHGTYILFRTGPRRGGSTLILPRSGGGTPRRILTEAISAWSPDSTRIVSWWPQAHELTLTDVITGDSIGFIPLEAEFDWLLGVDWSPSGDAVVLATRREPSTYALWVVDVDGGDPKLLLEDSSFVQSPRWSSAGDIIYYVSWSNQANEVWKLAVGADGQARGSPSRGGSSLELLTCT